MKHSIFYIFMVIQAMNCDKPVLKHSRKNKIVENCLQRKCDADKNPQCVRIKRYNERLPYYVIASNQCELQHIECNDNVVNRTIVPMKYCGNDKRISDTNNNKNRTTHIRVKRSAVQPKPSFKPTKRKGGKVKQKNLKPYIKPTLRKGGKVKQKNLKPYVNTILRKGGKVKQKIPKPSVKKIKRKAVKKGTSKNKTRAKLKSGQLRANRKKQRLRQKHREGKGKKLNSNRLNTYPFSSETETDFENNEMKKLKNGIAGYVVKGNDETGMAAKHAELEAKAFGPPRNYRLRLKQRVNLYKRGVTRATPIPLFSAESINNSLGEVDVMQYDEPCPTVCPSRDVMVCAQCQHGIYRSFSSVCHMRMFGCNHPEEIMSLVSRVPCVMSSPFLSEKGMQPQGRIVVHEDDDVVLRFIKCREAGQLVDQRTLLDKIKKKDVPRTKKTLRKHHPSKRTQQKVYSYKYIYKFNTWYDAKFACDHSDAHLFYPRTSEEARIIYNNFFKKKDVPKPKFPNYIYVGIYTRIGRNFMTIDGKPISEVYENWAPGQPDNKNGNENCVAMNSRYEYHDVDCSERLSFICTRPVADRLRLRNGTEDPSNFTGFVEFITPREIIGSFKEFIQKRIEDFYKNSSEDDDGDNDENSTEDDDEDNDGDSDEDNDGDSDEDNDGDSDEDSDEDNDGDSDEDNDGDSDEDNDEDSDEDNDGDSDEDNDGDSDEDNDGDSDKDNDEDSTDDDDEDNKEDSTDDNDEDKNENSTEDDDEDDLEGNVKDNIQHYLKDPRCIFEPEKRSLKYSDYKRPAKYLNQHVVSEEY